MAKRPKSRRTVEEILQSTSDFLFPEKPEKKVKLNSQDCMGDTPLHVLVRREDVHGSRTLIEEGANVNSQGDMGETPLHIALKNGRFDIAELLLRAGARTDVKSKFDESPKEIAEQFGLENVLFGDNA